MKLTEAQARVLSVLSDAPRGRRFRSEFTRPTMDALIRRGYVDAPIGEGGWVYITPEGRTALSATQTKME